jgi:hypothetical protein
MNLAIGVSDADIIHIDKSYLTDASPRQRFRRPTSYTTNANHADVRIVQALQAVSAV